MRRSHNSSVLLSVLAESGIKASRLKSLIQECVEMELAVLYANPNKIPDDMYLEKKQTMIEARVFCLLLT